MYVCMHTVIHVFAFYLFDDGTELIDHKHCDLISATQFTVSSGTGLVLQKQMLRQRLRCKVQGSAHAKETERK